VVKTSRSERRMLCGMAAASSIGRSQLWNSAQARKQAATRPFWEFVSRFNTLSCSRSALCSRDEVNGGVEGKAKRS
jgi:hypothetical protein